MSRRMKRINELLLQEISRIVLERQHPEVGFVTFTGVDTTDDLMEAKVFYSVLGTEEEKERTAKALRSLQHELLINMRRLESLKYIPKFHFIYDETPSKAARVHDLLDKIHHEPPLSSPEAPQAGSVPNERAERMPNGIQRPSPEEPGEGTPGAGPAKDA